MSELKLNKTLIDLDMGVIPEFKLDCIYHDKVILDACDLFGSANCKDCSNYIKK